MDLLLDRVGHAVRGHRLIDRLAVDGLLGTGVAAEQSARIREDDRLATGRADHGAADGALGIVKIGADCVTPPCAGRRGF